MRKLILLLVLAFAVTSVYAGNASVKTLLLKTEEGDKIEALDLTSGEAIYTDPVFIGDDLGVRSLFITEDKAGGAGDVDISVLYSVLETGPFTIAEPSNSDGTVTADGNVIDALGDETKFIPFTARMNQYIQFKLDPDADSRITAYFNYLRDR